MSLKLSILCLCFPLFMHVTPVHAQQYGWQLIARPTTRPLTSVDCVDTLHGWCAGRDTVYRTTDGGLTWRGSSRPFGADLWRGLSFSDTLHGWVAGVDANIIGVIWRTTDGGLNWTEQQFVLNRAYRGTFSHSTNRNTTVGGKSSAPDTGLVIESTDGGVLWQVSHQYPNQNFQQVVFIDSLHGWIAANQSLVFRTVDGGSTWDLITTPRAFILSFVDSLNGWGAARFGNTVYRTTDGGLSWQLRFTAPDGDFANRDVSFADSLNGWLFGDTFYLGGDALVIYKTADGGLNWQPENFATAQRTTPTDGMMIDARHGWLVTAGGWVYAYRPTTSVAERLAKVPQKFSLRQNYPNPFNATTNIEYELPNRAEVTLTIYDMLGKKVRTLVHESQEAGVYRVQFNGAGLASGTYVCELVTTTQKETKQLTLLK